MQATLTEKLLRSLLAKGEQGKSIRDRSLTGFEARPGKQGITLSAVARLRGSGIRQSIRINVGRYPVMSLAEGRNRARLILRDLHDGIDPRARKVEQQRLEAAEREHRFDLTAERFIRQRLAGAKTGRALEQLIRRDLVCRWGDRPITAITRADVSTWSSRSPSAATVRQRATFWLGRTVVSMGCRPRFARALSGRASDRSRSPRTKAIRQRLLTEHELRLIWRAAAKRLIPTAPTSSSCCCWGCAGVSSPARPMGRVRSRPSFMDHQSGPDEIWRRAHRAIAATGTGNTSIVAAVRQLLCVQHSRHQPFNDFGESSSAWISVSRRSTAAIPSSRGRCTIAAGFSGPACRP